MICRRSFVLCYNIAMPNEHYKHFALLAILAYWPAALFMVRLWPRSNKHTFSQHAAANPYAMIVFGVAITIESTWYALFLHKWFSPTFNMPAIYTAIVSMAILLHLTAGLVPETGVVKTRIHRFVSYASVWLFIPSLFIMLAQPTISTAAKAVILLCLGYIFGCIALVTIKPKLRDHMLIIQSIFILTLPVSLIATTYLR